MQRRKRGYRGLCRVGRFLLGARGFQRDILELEVLQGGGRADHAHARCLYASMLRGEGATRTTLSGASHGHCSAGSAKALNGLGYEYFYGNHLPKNSTKPTPSRKLLD